MDSSAQLLLKLAFVSLLACTASAQLTPLFYLTRCPALSAMVFSTVNQAVRNEPRMGASLVRLFFHDCFVNGCDASVLLDGPAGEKNAFPNVNSLRGFEVIDAIKTRVEAVCPGVVSCADILALSARDSVLSLGGLPWIVPLGRRDARTASQDAANRDLPAPSSSLSQLISAFAAKGLSARDMTALSGAHTIGQSQCTNFRDRLDADTNIDPAFRTLRRANCPATSGGDSNLAPLDVQTPNRFDNAYFTNLLAQRGLLHSDQELFNNGTQDALVRTYALSNTVFSLDFAAAMVRMGNISPLTGTNGEIRRNCRVIN